MELLLKRKEFSENTTIGDLFIDGKFFCYVLEDKDRGLHQQMPIEEVQKTKIYGKTAIPYGKYEVAITFSNKFQKRMPLLMHVPGYEGIRIHQGNNEFHTLGCLLLGDKKAKDRISDSTLAFLRFFPLLDEALKNKKVFITIEKATENLIHNNI